MNNRGYPPSNYGNRRIPDRGCRRCGRADSIGPDQDCGCDSSNSKMPPHPGMPLAMTYVPWQNLNQVYDLTKALSIGTIFPELNKPFKYEKGGCR